LEILRILPLVSEVTSSQNVISSNNVTGGGVDYDSGPYDVTFPAGVTMMSFDVPINDDNICEEAEDFTLTINLSNGLTFGNPSGATVTIVDDEGKQLADKLQF